MEVAAMTNATTTLAPKSTYRGRHPAHHAALGENVPLESG